MAATATATSSYRMHSSCFENNVTGIEEIFVEKNTVGVVIVSVFLVLR